MKNQLTCCCVAVAIFVVGLEKVDAVADFPFRNISLPWADRVDDIVNRLTLQEMVEQMAYGGGACRRPSPPISRLGIKPYNFDTECLHGILGNPSTAFPQSVGLAATFSQDVLYQVAEVIGTEARAIFNNAASHGQYTDMHSISCLAPFINIMRHPLWGRVQEVYGEDPFLSGELAVGYIKGLQGNHKRYVRANAGCKVVDVHSGPENIPESRFSFNSIVSERDMRLTYLPNFKACIEAGSYNLMCSYNSINGVPACANKWLLTEVLRKEFGFSGYYISDEGAIERIFDSHKYVNSSIEAAVAAMEAGVNLDLTPSCQPYFLLLEEAVKRGMVSFDTIVDRVKPLFYTRMRLGEFDPPKMNPYNQITMASVQSPDHRKLAIEVATKTFVMLKNENNILPLRTGVKRLAIVGPMADNLAQLYGNYCPIPVPEYAQTPYVGLRDLGDITTLASGCDNNVCTKYNQSVIQNATQGVDLVIVCLGTGTLVEAEGKDRANMDLPGKQLQLLQDTVKYAAGAPVVLLLFTAGPVDITWAKTSPQIGAIIQCFFPAQATGESLHQVIAVTDGEVISPSGRLPYTWPASLAQVPPMTNYSMVNRTYRYFPGVPLYPFGYGLSYTSFKYANLQVLPSVVKAGGDVNVTITVMNQGMYTADEVVQVYIAWENCPVPMPQRQLVAVHRQTLYILQKVKVTMTIKAEQMKIWDDNEGFIYHIGVMSLWVGGQQPSQQTSVPSNVLYTTFQVI